MEEIWKDIDWAKNYQISNFGNVFNKKRKVLLTPNKCIKGGYYRVNISIKEENKRVVKTKYIHVLVSNAFLMNNYLDNNLFCNHIDGDKSNNKLDNLEVITKSENEKHAFRIGLKCLKGENHNHSKITQLIANNIKEMFNNGYRGKEIALKYNIAISTTYSIKNLRTWNY